MGASTNLYTWIQSSAQYNSTNTTGFYVVRRVRVVSQNGNNLYINVQGGNTTPTTLSFNTPVTVNANYSGTFIGDGAGLTNITGVSTNFTTTSNPTNAYVAGTLYTNLTGQKALLIGSFVQTGASASLIINYTNNGNGYRLPLAVAASAAVNIPFTVPLSPNATFNCTALVGYMTNTVLWSY
jgi:hypothetical protein